MKTIITILNYIDTGAPFLTLFFFIKPFKKLPRELLYIFWFVCIQFVTNLVSSILEHNEIPNYSTYAINIILSFSILSALFYRISNLTVKKSVPFVSLLFIVCTVYSIANGDGIKNFNSIVSALCSFLITGYCLSFFYWRLIKDNKSRGLTDGTFFWVVVGLFTYYLGNFFIFISCKYMIIQDSSIGMIWRFHNVLLSIFCFYTIYGLTCKNYQKT